MYKLQHHKSSEILKLLNNEIWVMVYQKYSVSNIPNIEQQRWRQLLIYTTKDARVSI